MGGAVVAVVWLVKNLKFKGIALILETLLSLTWIRHFVRIAPGRSENIGVSFVLTNLFTFDEGDIVHRARRVSRKLEMRMRWENVYTIIDPCPIQPIPPTHIHLPKVEKLKQPNLDPVLLVSQKAFRTHHPQFHLFSSIDIQKFMQSYVCLTFWRN